MRVLVTGASGQLGWELCKKGKECDFEILALDLPELDITNPSAVHKAVCKSKASLVINAAAYTAVDEAESDPGVAFAVNRDGPAFLANECSRARIALIHISTDYVFDGKKSGPYKETDPVSPLGVYGKSKASGEDKVRSGLDRHVILRTSWLYGTHGHNFVKTMLRLGAERDFLRVVNDQYGCPTYAADLAEAILTIALQVVKMSPIRWGTYNYCGRGATSWYGFAREIFTIAELRNSALVTKRIDPIATSEYPTPARRPANSVLDCSLISKRFGIDTKPWSESLAHMLDLYFQAETLPLT